MEAKGRKMVAMGVVIALCAVAMIGAGYAAFTGGNAKTYNEGNAASVGYITMVPGTDATPASGADWDAISTGDVTTKFSTYTFHEMVAAADTTFIAYSFAGGEPVTIGDYKALEIGSKDFNVANKTGAAITAINLAIKADKAVGNADFVYIIALGTASGQYAILNTTDIQNINNFTFAVANDASANLNVKIYIGVTPDRHSPVSGIGAPIIDTAYNALETEQKANYSATMDVKASSTNAPESFTGLNLAFTLTDATA